MSPVTQHKLMQLEKQRQGRWRGAPGLGSSPSEYQFCPSTLKPAWPRQHQVQGWDPWGGVSFQTTHFLGPINQACDGAYQSILVSSVYYICYMIATNSSTRHTLIFVQWFVLCPRPKQRALFIPFQATAYHGFTKKGSPQWQSVTMKESWDMMRIVN